MGIINEVLTEKVQKHRRTKKYDDFGLDPSDIDEHGHRFGFREWFMLQHYDGYQGKYKPYGLYPVCWTRS